MHNILEKCLGEQRDSLLAQAYGHIFSSNPRSRTCESQIFFIIKWVYYLEVRIKIKHPITRYHALTFDKTRQ